MDGGMTKDEVIKLALEAGFANVRGGLTDNGELSDYWDCWPKQLERFAALVAAAERNRLEEKFMKIEALMQIREKQPNKPCCLAEREACARVCDDWADALDRHKWPTPYECAEAIRARGNT